MITITDVGIICPIGATLEEVRTRLPLGESPGMQENHNWLVGGKPTVVGMVDVPDLPFPEEFAPYDCRNNRLLLAVLQQVKETVQRVIEQFGQDRVGIVLGTSTSGILSGEDLLIHLQQHGVPPRNYHYQQQELGSPSEFLAKYLNLTGPAYTLSTACSSSAKAFISAKHQLNAGLCDAVIVGGVDTLCQLTVNGFDGLESLSVSRCNPLSRNRNGINIGEGCALFVLSREDGAVVLSGCGESSDAYHVSAPDPEGRGAAQAMCLALEDAGLSPEEIGYINLHGTATPLNDSMEAKAVVEIFGSEILSGSTKPLTGHTLCAAGAIEAALCWIVLTEEGERRVPPNLWDGVRDPKLPDIRISERGDVMTSRYCMSNSFAFGGNNVSLIFGRAYG